MSGLTTGEVAAGHRIDGAHAEAAPRWWQREWVAIAALLIAAAVLFLAGLGGSTLWDQDEAKYTQVAREILHTGDPITLHVNRTPWFVHPPLYMWLQAATGWAFGFSEFTARVWSAVFGVIGILVTYLLGRMLFNRRTALLGAIVLMTMFQYFAQSRLAIFDVVLVAFMLLAFYAFVRSIRESAPRLRVWAFVWAGLGTLTKGPIALLLPAMAAAAFLWSRQDLHRWREIPWRTGLLVYALIALPWYVAEFIRHGWPFVRTVIGYYTLTRFLGVVEGQAGPWWYYGPVFGLGAFPWTTFFLAMIPYHATRWKHEGSRVVLLWCGITVAFYSLAGTKLPNYVLPVYPMAALGIAALWDAFLSGERLTRRYVGVAFALTMAALAVFAAEVSVFGHARYPDEFAALQRHLLSVAIGIAIWLGAATALHALRRPAASFGVLASTTVMLAGVLIVWTMPLVEAHRPVKEVAERIRSVLQPGDVLIGVGISEQQTLLFYTDHRVEWVDDSTALLELVCRAPRAVIVTRSAQLEEHIRYLKSFVQVTIRPVVRRGDLAAVLKEGTAGCRR